MNYPHSCIACGSGVSTFQFIPNVAVCYDCWQKLSIAERIAAVSTFRHALAIENGNWTVKAFGDKVTTAQKELAATITEAQRAISGAAKELRTAGQEAANLFEEAREDYMKRRKDGEFD